MTARLLDGAVVSCAGRDFVAHDEPPDEDGHGARWFSCVACDATVKPSDDALAAHECFECSGCSEFFTDLPVVDAWNGQRFCSADCHDETSERFWTSVWSTA